MIQASFKVYLDLAEDADIIMKLSKQTDQSGYVKKLIRRDMEKEAFIQDVTDLNETQKHIVYAERENDAAIKASKQEEISMEPRTKLVCNLGPKDMFRHPRTDGIWRATSRTEKLQGKKYYEAIQTDGNGISHLLGTERVELIEGGNDE